MKQAALKLKVRYLLFRFERKLRHSRLGLFVNSSLSLWERVSPDSIGVRVRVLNSRTRSNVKPHPFPRLSAQASSATQVASAPLLRGEGASFFAGIIGLLFVALTIGFLTGWTLPADKDGFKRHLFGEWTYSADIKQAGMEVSLGNTAEKARIQVRRGESAITMELPMQKSSIKKDDGSVVYEMSDKNLEARYQNVSNGIKEELILKKKPDTNVFSSWVKTDNIRVRLNPDGIPVFYNNKDEYQFHFDRPFMKDAKGTVSYGVRYVLVPSSDSPLLLGEGQGEVLDTSSASRGETSSQPSPNRRRSIPSTSSPYSSREKDGSTTKTLLADSKPVANPQPTTHNPQPTSYVLAIEVDKNWLNNPSRKYPITIDPQSSMIPPANSLPAL